MLLGLVFSAFAQDPTVCQTADPLVPYNTSTAYGFQYSFENVDLYTFALGAGNGALTYDNAPLTQVKVNAIVAAGPTGHTLTSYGHMKDESGDIVDHYFWLWTEKASENGRKYFWLLTDREITGDTQPHRFGTNEQVVWASRYSRNPTSTGETGWPTLMDFAATVQYDVSEYVQRFESNYLSGGSGGLVAAAKQNCAATYGAAFCNAAVWSGADRRTLIYKNKIEADLFVSSTDGWVKLHDTADPDESSSAMAIGNWILIIIGCGDTCPTIDQSTCTSRCDARGWHKPNNCAGGEVQCRWERSSDGGCDDLDCWCGTGCGNVMVEPTFDW